MKSIKLDRLKQLIRAGSVECTTDILIGSVEIRWTETGKRETITAIIDKKMMARIEKTERFIDGQRSHLRFLLSRRAGDHVITAERMREYIKTTIDVIRYMSDELREMKEPAFIFYRKGRSKYPHK